VSQSDSLGAGGAVPAASSVHEELARLGTATVYEASGREGLIDLDLIQVVPGSRAAGPARTVRCGQADNLMLHAVLAQVRPGDVVVLTMPEPAPVGVVGDLIATQAKAQGVAALLVDAAVRDVEDLQDLGLPIWARWIRVRGSDKNVVGAIDEPVEVGGAAIRPGDVVVLDADGAVVVAAERVDEVLTKAREREDRERDKRAKLQAGELSYDLDGLRARVEGT
jgi:4-hydroxy-4-methyl-2-oxoglutarate aldolase